jgi:hypothetical protein
MFFGFIKSEWKTLLLIFIIVIAVNSSYFYGLYEQTQIDGFVTQRNVKEGGDQMVYFSLMRQAAENKVLLLNLFTSEPQLGIFSPLWWTLGKIVQFSHLPVADVYYISLMASAVFLLLVVYIIIKPIFIKQQDRWLTLLFMVFAGGFGWLYYINLIKGAYTNADLINRIIPADIWFSEGFGFHSLRHSPLFVLSQAFLIIIFWLVAEKYKQLKKWQKIALFFLTFLLIIIHPYDALTIIVFLFCYGLIIKWRQIFKWWLSLWPLFLAITLAACYFFWLRRADPTFNGWFEQNITLSPQPLDYILGYFWFLVPAGLGVYFAYKNKQHRLLWLCLWLLSACLLMFSPIIFNYQRRPGSGIYVPLGILAIYGLNETFKKKNNLLKYLLIILLISISSLTFLVSTVINLTIIKKQRSLTVVSFQEKQAMNYYQNHSQDNDVLLTSLLEGNLFPGLIGRKIYLGHGHQTINFVSKKVFSNWFFSIYGSEKAKHQELIKRKIDYIWLGPTEQENGLIELKEQKYFLPIFSNNKVKIYKVVK